MKGFSCSAILSSSFPFSLSVPVFCSSVALLRKSPYCSYRWHARQTTLSYKARQKNAPFRPALRYPSPSRLRLAPRIVRAGRFFISSSHPPVVSSSHQAHLVSSPVSDIAGRRASRPVPRLVPRLGSIPDKAGRRASRHPISWAFFYFAHHLIPSRSSSRLLVSSGVSPHAVSCLLIR